MKTWLRADEWVHLARCPGDSRFITPPETMPEDDVQEVMRTCYGCVVRSECIQEVVKKASTGVWCASRWIGEVSLDDSPKEAKRVLAEAEETRLALSKTLDDELSRRGEF